MKAAKRTLVAVSIVTMFVGQGVPALAETGPVGETDGTALSVGEFANPYYAVAHPSSTISFPRGIAINPANGQLLAVSSISSNIHVHDPAGEIDVFTVLGAPRGIDIVGSNLFVAETTGDRISVWTLAGEFIRSWGTSGSGNGQFNDPCGVAISDVNEVFVLDTENDRIQVFDINGNYLRQWGSNGSGSGQFDFFCSGAGLAVDGGEVFVADSANDRIQVFDINGTYLRQWGSAGSAFGEFSNPHGVAVRGDGLVAVPDFGNDRVQLFTRGGLFQESVSVADPVGVVADESGGTFWVSTQATPDGLVVLTDVRCGGEVLTHVGTSYRDSFATDGSDDVVALGEGSD
ncbi:MAG: hypothetical protein HKN91_00230, partial [Acidimicrobiia bacterium]|nr:hypothetical protein [Acidimicrobiia bacterium]